MNMQRPGSVNSVIKSILAQDTLAALDIRGERVVLLMEGVRASAAMALAGVVALLAALLVVFVSRVAFATGGEFSFAEDELEERLEGGDAGGDDDDVGFDAGVCGLWVRVCVHKESGQGVRDCGYLLGPDDKGDGSICLG